MEIIINDIMSVLTVVAWIIVTCCFIKGAKSIIKAVEVIRKRAEREDIPMFSICQEVDCRQCPYKKLKSRKRENTCE